MQLLHCARTTGRRMQWICGAEVVDIARRVADGLARSQGIGVDLWQIDDWVVMAQQGIACERQWRQGARLRIDSRFEQLLAATPGPILAVTQGERSLPEMLRAFVPAGRVYLSLSGDDGIDALGATAVRLDALAQAEWVGLSAI